MSRLRAGLPPAPSIERIALATGNGRKIKSGGENYLLALMAAMRTCLLLQTGSGRTENKIRQEKLPVGADGCHATCLLSQVGSGWAENKIRRGKITCWRGCLPC